MQLLEYERPGWTFHAKGLWYVCILMITNEQTCESLDKDKLPIVMSQNIVVTIINTKIFCQTTTSIT